MATGTNIRRLILLLLGLAAVVVAVVHLTSRETGRETEGLTVGIEVVDSAGKAVPRASVQCRFRPGWVRADSRGAAEVPDVVLRAGEDAGPEAIEAALEVVAPHHALPWGRHPTVTQDHGGRWHARYVLVAFGTLRLSIKGTNLPAPKAWVEAVGETIGVEAIGGAQVARVGQPVKVRVYEGAERLRIHLTGAAGTVTRVTEIEAPAAGFDRQVELTAEEAVPIHGRILGPVAPRPPLIGYLRVFQSGASEAIELPPIEVVPGVDDETFGVFKVPYTGNDRYRIVPHLEGLEAEPVIAKGGDHVDIAATPTAPWIGVPFQGVKDSRFSVRCQRRPDGPIKAPTLARLGPPDREFLAFYVPEAGRYRVTVDFPGSSKKAPRRWTGEVDVGASGPHIAGLASHDRPWGAVTVEVEDPAGRGATVQLLAPERRSGTLLPGLGTAVRFRHVPVGPVLAKVTWRDPEAAVAILSGVLEADAAAVLPAKRVAGGTLVLENRSRHLAGTGRALRLHFEAGRTPYGDAAGTIGLRSDTPSNTWTAREPLRSGAYEAVVKSDEDEAGVEIAFEIRAGEVTTVPYPGS